VTSLPLGVLAEEPTVLAQRKPLLLLRFAGVLLLRLAERRFVASLFQLPPRRTRFECPTSLRWTLGVALRPRFRSDVCFRLTPP
jgi:hypothetical protein